ncbi:MAG: AsmA family protein [Pseudodesulfovibrio sp.]
MNKAVKMSMIGFGIIATLVIVAVIVFASTFDINNYKDRISEAVLDETGRTLSFDGDLDLVFFPNLGVQLGGLSLSNAPGFGEEPMIETRSALVTVRFLPLLKGDIKFGHLALDGLTLNLSRDDGGVANWDDLVGKDKAQEEQGKNDDGGQFSLEISGVTIKDANLLWDDKVSETRFIVRGLNLETGRIYQGSPFAINANLKFECPNPNAKGSLTFSGKSSIDLANREYGHMDMKLSVTAEGDAIPGGKGTADMTVQFAVMDFNKEHAQVTGLSVTAYGATMHMDATIEGISHGLKKLAATVTIDPFDAKKTLANMGMAVPVTADPAALTKVGGMAEFVYSPRAIHLKTLEADLDGSRIVGNGRFKNESGEPFYFARLDVGKLDLDRYLPPDHAVTKQESKTAAASNNRNARLIDTQLLRGRHLDIEAQIAELRIEKALLSNVKVVIKARHGLLRVSPLSANLYGGSLSAGLTINAMRKYPQIDIIAGLDKVNIAPLSKDILGKKSYAGILNFNSALSCNGERIPGMLRSMNGKLSFNLADGVFPGVDLIHMAKTTHASKDKTGAKIESKDTASTKFGSIAGTANIAGGILRNKDLEVKAPGLRASGHGAVVLPTRQIDYMLKVKLVPTSQGQGGKSSDDLYGVMVPIRVAGTIEHPYYWVSITEYVKALGGAVLGAAGSVLGGVTKAIKGVGQAVDENCCENDETPTPQPTRKKFLGIF